MMGNSDSFGEKVVKISSLDQFPKGHQKLLSREGEERERGEKRCILLGEEGSLL
jgi:hypothetical protein